MRAVGEQLDGSGRPEATLLASFLQNIPPEEIPYFFRYLAAQVDEGSNDEEQLFFAINPFNLTTLLVGDESAPAKERDWAVDWRTKIAKNAEEQMRLTLQTTRPLEQPRLLENREAAA